MWKDKLTVDRTSWLLEYSNPSVRYWGLKDLLDLGESHPEVVEARDMIMESPVVNAILGAMNPEGYWENPDDMYLPKYTATTHQILILAELGARRTPRIEKAVEHIFRFQRNSGHFLTNMPKTERGRDFVTRGARRLVELFKGRWSVERLFGRAKEWLLLGCLKFRGLEQAAIHACLSFTAMLTVAVAAVDGGQPGLIRSIKHFTV